MNDSRQRLRIGVLVLVSLTALAAMVLMFGSLPTLFTPHIRYVVRFKDATGVGDGTPVRRSGVRIGQVESLELDEDSGDVRVTLLVRRKYPIRKNEQPVITRSLISGDAFIDLVPKEQPPEQVDRSEVDPGWKLVSVAPANVNTLINQAAEVVPATQQTLTDIRRSLQRFEQMAPGMDEAIREVRNLARETRAELPGVRQTSDEFRELARQARAELTGFRSTSDEVRELARATRAAVPEVRALAKSANEMVPELRRTNDEIQVAVRNWGKLGERLDLLVQTNQDQVDRIIKQIPQLLEHLDTVIVRAASVLSEENQRNVMTILKNIRVASERFDSISQNTDGLLKDSRSLPQRMEDALTQAENTLKRADRLFVNLEKTTAPLTERGSRLFQNVDEAAEKLNRLLTGVGELVQSVGQSDGTLRRFITDPTLYNSLADAACMAAKLVPRLERVLRDIEVFADKVARHPELLGVGGAVSPSAGLKEGTSGYWPRK